MHLGGGLHQVACGIFEILVPQAGIEPISWQQEYET